LYFDKIPTMSGISNMAGTIDTHLAPLGEPPSASAAWRTYLWPEDRGQRTEDRGQRTEDRGQRTENFDNGVIFVKPLAAYSSFFHHTVPFIPQNSIFPPFSAILDAPARLKDIPSESKDIPSELKDIPVKSKDIPSRCGGTIAIYEGVYYIRS
jgi:hypothetical protein